MRTKILLVALAVLTATLLTAQTNNRITGPLGVYHIAAGYSYSDSTGADSVIMQTLFRFGELAIPNQAIDNGMDFIPEIDSCISWNANRVIAIIQPPNEHGVYNQPADTSLLAPYLQLNGPGMVQGGQRFSRLSEQYGGFCGVILDDWTGDLDITRQVRDAVQGKYVDELGNVHGEGVAHTPNNKLYCVVYGTDSIPGASQVIDGVEFYNVNYQNCCLSRFDSDIDTLRANYPGKEIQLGIYLQNSGVGWLQPEGVHYWLAHGLNRYDDGDLNGVTIFAGVFLIKERIPLNIWNGFNLPHWLDSLYFPCLGAGDGKLYDCNTGSVLTDGFVRVYCKGRVSGDTLFRSRQKTDATGQYHFGLWAGNRDTDSTLYWLIAEKKGYINDTVGFWIRRGDTTTIPSLMLCPVPDTMAGKPEKVELYPNPTSGKVMVLTDAGEQVGGELEVYNMLGKKVYATPRDHHYLHVNLSGLESGVYLVVIRTGTRGFNTKQLLVVQH